jgi:fatty acid desaturase 2 (delta-6 desaturase)
MKTIRIDGTLYDISNFKHPGGSVIEYAGQGDAEDDDAGDAFREFHARSTKAKAVLASLPKVNATAASEPAHAPSMSSDFRDMRKQLEIMGCFEPDYIHVYFRLLELAFFFGLGVFLVPYNIYASMLAFIAFKTRCGWVQHEGGHLSLTGVKSIDRGIQVVTMGFGGGASSTLWNSMHHKHHAAPQRVNYDIDLDTTPFVAFFKGAFENSTRITISSSWLSEKIARVWMRLQAWFFLPITNGVLVHFFWTYYLHPQRALRAAKKEKNGLAILELVAIAASHVVIPSIFYTRATDDANLGILYCYFLLMVCNAFNFMYLFGHFSLSHTFTDVVPENKSLKWFEYAIQHSVNISTQSPLVTWVMGYLNFQIEHHLFPSMPQYKNAIAAPYVKEFCKRWPQVQYTEVDYWTAWKEMFKNLNDAGTHYYRNGFKSDDFQQSADAVPEVVESTESTEPIETPEPTNVKSDSEDEYESEFDKLKLD